MTERLVLVSADEMACRLSSLTAAAHTWDDLTDRYGSREELQQTIEDARWLLGIEETP